MSQLSCLCCGIYCVPNSALLMCGTVSLGCVCVRVRVCFTSSRSFFQSICTLGYCLLPLVLALILSVNLSALGDSSSSFVKFRLVIKTISVIAAVAWSVYGKLLLLICLCA